MNKAELIERIAREQDLTKRDAANAIDGALAAIVDEVRKGNVVTLPGFGTFRSAVRAAREGTNPNTGEKISIKAKRVPKFIAGKYFKVVVDR